MKIGGEPDGSPLICGRYDYYKLHLNFVISMFDVLVIVLWII